MAKFIIVLCAVVACVAGHPGLLNAGSLGYASPLAYSSQLAYSSPLALSAPVAYASPLGYNLFPGGSNRIDIQTNYNVGPQYALPLAVGPVGLQAQQIATAPAPVAIPAPLAAPQLIQGPQLLSAPLRYNAPLLAGGNLINGYNAAVYGSPLSYALPAPLGALPLAARLAAVPAQLTASPAPAAAVQLNAAPAPASDSDSAPAKLSEPPAQSADEKVIATPAPVDSSPAANDASEVTQSPVAPVRNQNY